MTKISTRQSVITLAVFFSLLVVFYVLGYWLIFRMGKATPLMLSAGVATILTCLLCGRQISELGWKWGEWKYQWHSYLIPLLYAFAAYLLAWIVGIGSFYDSVFVEELRQDYGLATWNDTALIMFHFVFVATIGFIMLLPSVLGEEIAWRGFLVPELAKSMSFVGVSLTSGVVWSVFHWPLILLGLYGSGDIPLAYQLTVFTVFIVSTSIVMTYHRIKSGSLWTAVVFHMSMNIFLQKFFDPLTAKTENSDWYLNEFGVLTAATTLCFGLYYLYKGHREFSHHELAGKHVNEQGA